MKATKLTLRRIGSFALSGICLLAVDQNLRAQSKSDARQAKNAVEFLDGSRTSDGLRGPVRRVRTEVAKFRLARGVFVEQPRTLLEITVYNVQGNRIENETYPMVSNTVGIESHRYDERGNLVETIARDAHGNVLSKTVYTYEFDAVGNWTKMASSVVVVEAGREKLEPVEVVYRTISYYSGVEAVAAPKSEANETAKVAAPQRMSTKTTDASDAPAPEAAAQTKQETTPASLPATGELVDVGVINEKALSLPNPSYIVSGRRSTTPVVVKVEVIIDETGQLISARAVEGPQPLRKSSEDAARKAVFLPFRDGTKLLRVRGFINYSFAFAP